jgi:hypothetical protein
MAALAQLALAITMAGPKLELLLPLQALLSLLLHCSA